MPECKSARRLEVIQLARRAQNRNGLRRYSHVSTVAVAGRRQNEIVTEDASIDWARSDYDPYARTKKFGEHMVRQLLHDVPTTIFRPASSGRQPLAAQPRNSTWSRPSMCWPGCRFFLCGPTTASISCPPNYVGKAIVTIHQKDSTGAHHLSLIVGRGFANVPRINRRTGGRGKNRQAHVLALAGRPIFRNGGMAFAPRRRHRLRRVPAESLLAVFELEHRI